MAKTLKKLIVIFECCIIFATLYLLLANIESYNPDNPFNGITFYWLILPFIFLSLPFKIWLIIVSKRYLASLLMVFTFFGFLIGLPAYNYMADSVIAIVFSIFTICAALDNFSLSNKLPHSSDSKTQDEESPLKTSVITKQNNLDE